MNDIFELPDGIFRSYKKIIPCADGWTAHKGEYKGSYFDRWYKATLNLYWDKEGKYWESCSFSIDE